MVRFIFVWVVVAASLVNFSTTALSEDAAPTTASAAAVDRVPQLRVLETRRVPLGNRAIIFNRVEPPVRQPAPSVTQATVQPTAEELAAWAAQVSPTQKKQVTQSLWGRIFLDGVVELCWHDEDREYLAYSNINFDYWGGWIEFETGDTRYSFLVLLWNDLRDLGLRDPVIPPIAQFNSSRSEYFVSENPAAPLPAEAFTGMEALHLHFDANKDQIIEAHNQRVAAQAAQEQWLKDHPPVPKDTVINFWPKKSRKYPTR